MRKNLRKYGCIRFASLARDPPNLRKHTKAEKLSRSLDPQLAKKIAKWLRKWLASGGGASHREALEGRGPRYAPTARGLAKSGAALMGDGHAIAQVCSLAFAHIHQINAARSTPTVGRLISL
jgi:hypothetical protein